MNNDNFYKGFFLAFLFLGILGTLTASGWHIANEILSGDFGGNYTFSGTVNFSSATVNGLPSSGMLENYQEYLTPGSYTFEFPSDAKFIYMVMAAGGSAGKGTVGACDGGESSSFGNFFILQGGPDGVRDSNNVASGSTPFPAIAYQDALSYNSQNSYVTHILGSSNNGAGRYYDGAPGAYFVGTLKLNPGTNYTVVIGSGGDANSGCTAGFDGGAKIWY